MTDKEMIVLYGTETGNSELLAMDACKLAPNYGIEAKSFGMDEISADGIKDASLVMIICSTWGDGEQPDNAQDLFDSVEDFSDGDLDGVQFCVLALGDTAFDLFCEAGKEWDRVLEEKGGTRINERIDCDVDYEDESEEWIEETLEMIQSL